MKNASYDSMGFFVITLNQGEGQILIDYYLSANAPAHFVRAAW